jgi:HEPN domain-containing protein
MYRGLIEPYKQTALRHIEMANILLDVRFHDGAAFHIYHAYECIICAALLKRQPQNMPPLAHPAKLDRFRQIFANERVITERTIRLSSRLYSVRNRVLYPELRDLSIIIPITAVSERQARGYLSQVKQFVNLLISQLRL